MDQIINQIIEWLGQTHGSRDTYGWIYVLGIGMSIWGSIKAKEYVAQRKALHAAKAESSKEKKLSASLYTKESGTDVLYTATLSSNNNKFLIRVVKQSFGSSEPVVEEAVSSMEEAASFLRANTKFILADFK